MHSFMDYDNDNESTFCQRSTVRSVDLKMPQSDNYVYADFTIIKHKATKEKVKSEYSHDKHYNSVA